MTINIAFVLHPTNPQAKIAAECVGAELTKRKVNYYIDSDLWRSNPDFIFVFGGDGTILSTARKLNGRKIPVVGINFGKFGFLAEFEYDSFLTDPWALDRILHGNWNGRSRTMLHGEVIRKEKSIWQSYCLNEFVISRSSFSQIVPIKLFIDSLYCTTYHGDGIILSTPAGSTAHNLSAGGPVVHPRMDVVIVTPICPHALTIRPMVVPCVPIMAEIEETTTEIGLTADGHEYTTLQAGDVLKITPKPGELLLVQSQRNFWETLRAKLNWSGHANLKQ